MSIKIRNNIFIGSFEDALEHARIRYTQLENDNKRLRQKINSFDEKEKIKSIKREIEDIKRRSLCIFSNKELVAEQKFIATHYQKHNCIDNKNTGNSWIYKLTSTGIGTVIEIQCPICGESENITDYDNW